MISLATGTEVLLACRPIDLGNGFDGLAAKAESIIDAYPFSATCSCSAASTGIIAKTCTGTDSGLCLFAERLKKWKFVWPPIVNDGMVLTPSELALLIEAMDWRRTIAPAPTAQPMLL